ncbi:hypothetical protein AAFC00_007029 [Neodothiora populina]|uniref:Phosphoglycerate mutase-like protein n=1 Tax=Neodothiora populina TaxID=2781224 RepID=A0ABR3PBZ1_9PEZI
MPPTLILIRHGEALHNVEKDYSIPDPVLTKLGRKQCADLHEQLKESLPLAQQVEAIVSSPMVRTIETTLIGLDWLIKKSIPIELDPLWQENSSKPCDTGSPVAELKKRFSDLDWSPVESTTYPDKTGPGSPYAFTKTAVLARGQTCLKNLYQRKEKVVAVVAHSGFLRCAVSHNLYANADYRVFDFVSNTDPEKPELAEWDLTADNGGGMGTSEKGRVVVSATDFPPEETVAEVRGEQGKQIQDEAAKEVP